MWGRGPSAERGGHCPVPLARLKSALLGRLTANVKGGGAGGAALRPNLFGPDAPRRRHRPPAHGATTAPCLQVPMRTLSPSMVAIFNTSSESTLRAWTPGLQRPPGGTRGPPRHRRYLAKLYACGGQPQRGRTLLPQRFGSLAGILLNFQVPTTCISALLCSLPRPGVSCWSPRQPAAPAHVWAEAAQVPRRQPYPALITLPSTEIARARCAGMACP